MIYPTCIHITNIINATGGNDDITIKDGSNTLNIGDAIDARVYVQEGESTNTINDGAGNNSYNLYTGTTTEISGSYSCLIYGSFLE